jgi:hypothetical protein
MQSLLLQQQQSPRSQESAQALLRSQTVSSTTKSSKPVGAAAAASPLSSAASGAADSRPVSPDARRVDWQARPWDIPVREWQRHAEAEAEYHRRKQVQDYAYEQELGQAVRFAAHLGRRQLENAYPDVITPELWPERWQGAGGGSVAGGSDVGSSFANQASRARVPNLSVATTQPVATQALALPPAPGGGPLSTAVSPSAATTVVGSPSSQILGRSQSAPTSPVAGGKQSSSRPQRLLSPKLTRSFTASNADRLRSQWATEAMNLVCSCPGPPAPRFLWADHPCNLWTFIR